jgi:hypothetical protein
VTLAEPALAGAAFVSPAGPLVTCLATTISKDGTALRPITETPSSEQTAATPPAEPTAVVPSTTPESPAPSKPPATGP